MHTDLNAILLVCLVIVLNSMQLRQFTWSSVKPRLVAKSTRHPGPTRQVYRMTVHVTRTFGCLDCHCTLHAPLEKQQEKFTVFIATFTTPLVVSQSVSSHT